jgi:hypothetical protein
MSSYYPLPEKGGRNAMRRPRPSLHMAYSHAQRGIKLLSVLAYQVFVKDWLVRYY